jgi:hypothetical protein
MREARSRGGVAVPIICASVRVCERANERSAFAGGVAIPTICARLRVRSAFAGRRSHPSYMCELACARAGACSLAFF